MSQIHIVCYHRYHAVAYLAEGYSDSLTRTNCQRLNPNNGIRTGRLERVLQVNARRGNVYIASCRQACSSPASVSPDGWMDGPDGMMYIEY